MTPRVPLISIVMCLASLPALAVRAEPQIPGYQVERSGKDYLLIGDRLTARLGVEGGLHPGRRALSVTGLAPYVAYDALRPSAGLVLQGTFDLNDAVTPDATEVRFLARETAPLREALRERSDAAGRIEAGRQLSRALAAAWSRSGTTTERREVLLALWRECDPSYRPQVEAFMRAHLSNERAGPGGAHGRPIPGP